MPKSAAESQGQDTVVDPLPKGTEYAVESEELSTSDESGPSLPEQKDASTTKEQQPKEERRKPESLAERGRVPYSFYVSVLVIGMLEGCSGMWQMDTLRSWWSSFTTSIRTVRDLLEYEKDLMQSIFEGDFREPKEYLQAAVVTVLAGSILWVLIGKPLSAGLWTGERSKKHKMHRYMGLFFLIQYGLAWVEFITNYKGAGEFSYIPHTVALNGAFCNMRSRESSHVDCWLILIYSLNDRCYPRLFSLLFLQGAADTERSRLLLRQRCHVTRFPP